MIINCIIFASNSSNQLDPNGLFHIQGSVIFQTVKQIAIHTFSHQTRRICRVRSAHILSPANRPTDSLDCCRRTEIAESPAYRSNTKSDRRVRQL